MFWITYRYSGVRECLEIAVAIEEAEHDPHICIYVAYLSDNLRHRNQASQEYQPHIDSHHEVQEPFRVTEINMIGGFFFYVYISCGPECRKHVLHGHFARTGFNFDFHFLSCKYTGVFAVHVYVPARPAVPPVTTCFFYFQFCHYIRFIKYAVCESDAIGAGVFTNENTSSPSQRISRAIHNAFCHFFCEIHQYLHCALKTHQPA